MNNKQQQNRRTNEQYYLKVPFYPVDAALYALFGVMDDSGTEKKRKTL